MISAALLLASLLTGPLPQRDGYLRERRASDEHVAAKDAAEGREPPSLKTAAGALTWLNGSSPSLDIASLRGQVVLVCFWNSGTAGAGQIQPQLNALAREFQAAGLRVLGIHSVEGGASLADLVVEQDIPYPVAWDSTGAVSAGWMVDDQPDYWLIDRGGKVRVADLGDSSIGTAVQRLLKEPAPEGLVQRTAQPTTTVLERVTALAQSCPEASYGIHYNGERLGRYTMTNRLEVVKVEGKPPITQLHLEDRTDVRIQSIELQTVARCTYRIEVDRAILISAQVETQGLASGPISKSFEQTPTGGVYLSGNRPLVPTHPAFTDLFLMRLPALVTADFDPGATRSWINFVDGKLYDSVTLEARGLTTTLLRGERHDSWRWTLAGKGLAAPSELLFDQHGKLLSARLEGSQVYRLEDDQR
ncbi:MAG: cytochrome c biogenesis protein CcmG/thiol:disulfide interchange protein DsbE [Planctomycetota bacterium]|jgi:cytochrome c biogenesis protein CcmG/thiol:disulfide interchange protein DsbE